MTIRVALLACIGGFCPAQTDRSPQTLSDFQAGHAYRYSVRTDSSSEGQLKVIKQYDRRGYLVLADSLKDYPFYPTHLLVHCNVDPQRGQVKGTNTRFDLPAGKAVPFQMDYNDAGLLIHWQSGRSQSMYEYDSHGNCTKEFQIENGDDPRVVNHVLDYDQAGNLIRESSYAHSTIDYTYAENGIRMSAHYRDIGFSQEKTYTYDSLGRLASESQFAYSESNPLRWERIDYHRDALGRLTMVDDLRGNRMEGGEINYVPGFRKVLTYAQSKHDLKVTISETVEFKQSICFRKTTILYANSRRNAGLKHLSRHHKSHDS